MTRKVSVLGDGNDKKQRAIDGRLQELVPKLTELEGQMENLSQALKGPAGSDSALPENLTKKFSQVQSMVEQLESETIPLRIQENSDALVESMADLSQYCDQELTKLQNSLDRITATTQIVEQQRTQTEESLDQLLTGAFEIQAKVQALDQEATAKLAALEESFEAASRDLNAQLSNPDGSQLADPTDVINTGIGNLRTQIQDKCKKLKAEIKLSSAANKQAQVKAAEELSLIRDAVLGKGNLMERLNAVEDMVTWCIDHIKVIDADRIEAQKKGGSAQNVVARIANIKDRINGAAARFARIEELQGGPSEEEDNLVTSI
jgi:SMC interacting uncharacterized protein involved in chromosome segregation